MGIRVGVFGAGGRMGAAVCAAVAEDLELDLVAAIDPAHAGDVVEGMTVVAEASEVGAQIDVVIDFTLISAARANAQWAAENGVHAVIGTSGFNADDFDRLRAAFTRSNCVIAPNFAIGAVLMMRFAAEASRHMAKAEIVELHHDGKLDAPSGTAKRTAELMEGEVPIHSVRLPGLVAHQEVIFGGEGQTLSIRHDSIDRSSFMPGVLLAVRRVGDLPDRFVVGLENLL